MIKLYALKCDRGYIKNSVDEELKCVGLNKASVFGAEGLDKVENTLEIARSKGLSGLRLVELHITENDPHKPRG